MTIPGPGSTISHYRIVDTLGHGGQATAFKAEDLRLARPVVIKALKPELALSETARRRFEREATLCSALDNPTSRRLRRRRVGRALLHRPAVRGGPTLKQYMAAAPSRRCSRCRSIQIADALAVAHAAGIVHRDLKPPTSSWEPTGRRASSTSGSPSCWSPTSGAERDAAADGRPRHRDRRALRLDGYGSPEQARGEIADHRTGVFSLASCSYEMVTGSAPFRAATRSKS
jgi:serine/threonine protein kinase